MKPKLITNPNRLPAAPPLEEIIPEGWVFRASSMAELEALVEESGLDIGECAMLEARRCFAYARYVQAIGYEDFLLLALNAESWWDIFEIPTGRELAGEYLYIWVEREWQGKKQLVKRFHDLSGGDIPWAGSQK